jgi:hypothetical protein
MPTTYEFNKTKQPQILEEIRGKVIYTNANKPNKCCRDLTQTTYHLETDKDTLTMILENEIPLTSQIRTGDSIITTLPLRHPSHFETIYTIYAYMNNKIHYKPKVN